MKFVIDQKTFLQALSKGALAALSEEAQGELTNAAPIIKSVKIDVSEDKMVLESGCKSTVSRYVLEFPKDSKICKEKGCGLIPAKDLFNWVERQNGSTIRVSLEKFANPKMVSTIGSDMEGANADKSSVKQMGTVEIVSIDSTQTGSKWSLDCYDPDQFNTIDFGSLPTPLFKVGVPQLKEAIKSVAFAAQTKDTYHVYNSIKFQQHGNDVYMGTTDKARCAIYKVNASDVNFDEKKEGILVLVKFLSPIVDLSDESLPISFIYDKKGHKIFLSQPNFVVRLVTAEAKSEAKFTSLAQLLDKKYTPYCKMGKDALTSRLITVSMVNKQMGEFTFKKTDKGTFLRIQAVSESGKSPAISTLPVTGLQGEDITRLHVQNLMDALKVFKDDEVTICVPNGSKGSVKITSDDDPSFLYYLMTLDPQQPQQPASN